MKRRIKLLCCIGLLFALLTGCADNAHLPAAEASHSPAPAAEMTVAIGQALLDESTLWRYSAGQGDPTPRDPALWRQRDFDDSAWPVAAGRFGAKNGAIAAMGDHVPTVLLPMADDSGARIPAYFFRASFGVADPAQIPALEGTLSYDDAVIVYVNGETVFSGNLPEAGFDGNFSYGADSAQDEPRTETFRVPANMLRAGENTVAVEVHQAAASSSDVYFAFHSLCIAENTGTLSVTGPCLFTAGADVLTARWFGDGRDMTLRYARNGNETYPAEAQAIPAVREHTEGGIRYSAALTGLAPATQYRFWIEDGVGHTNAASFTTATSDGFSFLLAGDPQLTGQTSASAFHEALSVYPDVSFALCAGDSVNSAEDMSQYRLFLNAVAESGLPVAAVIGNHEGPALYDLFLAPEGTVSYGRSFRFSYGNALFVCIDSNSEDYAGQEAFLRESIAAGDWNWVIVCMHHSLFSLGKHADSTSIAALRARYAPLFTACDVDVVLSGHDHLYSRTMLMENAVPASNASADADMLEKTRGQTLYICAGSSTGSKYYERTDVDEAPFAAVAQEERPTLTRVEVTDDELSVYSCYADDLTTFDRVTLTHAETAEKHAASPQMQALFTQLLTSEKDFLLSTQLSNGAFSTYSVNEGENTVTPYFADYAALALLRVGETDAVRRYLDWRMARLNTGEYDVNGLPYTIYDYTVTLENGVIVSEQATMSYDSTDSYAATLLMLVSDYYETTGDAAYLRSIYPQIAGITQVLLATMENELTVARPDYRVQYLMDNCEVASALVAADKLYSTALLPGLSGTQRDGAVQLHNAIGMLSDTVKLGIERRLWNNEAKRYEMAVQPDGYAFPFDETKFYPDAVTQLSPIVFGLLDPASSRAADVYATFCETWDWQDMAHVSTKATNHCWGMLAYCAARMGDDARLLSYLSAYTAQYAAEHPYPLYCADAAWIILACTLDGDTL